MNLLDLKDELAKLLGGAGNAINQGAQNVSNFVQQPIKIAQQGITNWAAQPQNYQKAQALQTWQPLLQPIQTAQRSLASQNITNLPQFATKVMGNAPQQFNQYVQNVSNQAKLPQVIPSVVGSMGKTILAGPSTVFQKKSNWEHAGDVLGTVGAVTNPFNSLMGGTIGTGFQAIVNSLNKKPITQNLDQAFGQGVDFSSKLGPISEATNWALGPILSKLNPTGMQSWNTYINLAKNATSDAGKSRALMALTNAIIGQLGQKTITGLIGMGAYGATMPAKDLNERLGNFIDNAVQGAGYEVGSHVLGQVGNVALNQAKDIKLQNRPGFVKIGGEQPSTPQGGVQNIKIKGVNTSSMPSTQQPQMGVPQGSEGKLLPDTQAPVMQDNKPPSINSSSLSSIPQNSTPLNNLNIQGEQPKGFVSTVKNAPGVLPEVKSAAEGILPQTQQPITNKESFATAQNRIDTQGVDAAHQYVLSNAPYDAEKAGTAQLLMKQYAENIKTPGNYEKFQQLTDSIDQQARTAGQGIQSLSNWDKLSPKAILNVANTTADRLGQELPADFQKQVITRAAEIQKMTEGSPERTQAVQGLLKDIADQLPSTKGELFDAYRYMNMLSGPVTVEKIGYGGLFNTLVTRPIDLFAEATTQHLHQLADSSFQRTVSYSDIPQWYKDAYLGLPDAWNAALQGWKQGNVDKAFQEGQSGQSTINKLRQQNLPGILTAPGKVHGFVYNFFSSIIGGAERSRLMENGVDEATATKLGQELGDKFTLRSPLGGKDQATAVKAVDGLGQLATKMQDIPVLGTFSRWIAPFMKVSTNFVKLGVEHSPLALPDSVIKFAQGAEGADANLAHAMVGSLVTGLGAMAVAKDMVTGAAPTDKKQSDLFYASGRKPYSVNIPGVGWTPYQYFGPLGLSLMLPQAVKDATSGVNATKDVSEKVLAGIGNTTKMIIAGTPLPSITGFFNMLAGDTSVNPNTFMADMTSQLIPFEAMQRYVAQIIDPIYRKASSYTDRLKSGIPMMTQGLQPYITPLGQPETRNATNFVAPYAIGQPANQYEPAYQSRQNTLNSNAIINQANKNAQNGGNTDFSQGGIKISPEITKLPDGTFSYQITDTNGQTTINQAKTQKQAQLAIDKNTFSNSDKDSSYVNGVLYTKQSDGTITSKKIDVSTPIPPPQLTGDKTLDKKLIAQYQSDLSSRANDIVTLYQAGQLTQSQATDALTTIQNQSSAYKAAKKPKKITIAKFKAPKISTAGFKIAIAKVSKPPTMPTTKMSKVKAIKISGNRKITLKK